MYILYIRGVSLEALVNADNADSEDVKESELDASRFRILIRCSQLEENIQNVMMS